MGNCTSIHACLLCDCWIFEWTPKDSYCTKKAQAAPATMNIDDHYCPSQYHQIVCSARFSIEPLDLLHHGNVLQKPTGICRSVPIKTAMFLYQEWITEKLKIHLSGLLGLAIPTVHEWYRLESCDGMAGIVLSPASMSFVVNDDNQDTTNRAWYRQSPVIFCSIAHLSVWREYPDDYNHKKLCPLHTLCPVPRIIMIASLMSFQGGLSDTITYPFFRLGMIWSIQSTWCARRVQAERDQDKKTSS